MTYRSSIRDDDTLERALGHLNEDVLFPDTPNLAKAFQDHAQAIPRVQARMTRRWQFAALAAVLMVALIAVFPGARSTVAGWMEFAGIRIEIGDDSGDPDDAPLSPEADLFLGRQVTLAEASASVSFEVLVLNSSIVAGEPGSYLDHRDGSPVVSVVYPASETLPEIGETGLGMVLMQFDPTGDTGMYIKRTVADTSPVFLEVNGSFGAWIENGSLAIPPTSNRAGVERQSGHVLIWEQDGVTIRMETNLTLHDSLRFAERLTPVDRPGTVAP